MADYVNLPISEATEVFDAFTLTDREELIASRVLREIRERLRFLHEVGVGYLTLNRSAATLSGGESGSPWPRVAGVVVRDPHRVEARRCEQPRRGRPRFERVRACARPVRTRRERRLEVRDREVGGRELRADPGEQRATGRPPTPARRPARASRPRRTPGEPAPRVTRPGSMRRRARRRKRRAPRRSQRARRSRARQATVTLSTALLTDE